MHWKIHRWNKELLHWKLTYFSSKITGCVSISVFASLLGIPVGITSSAVGSNICLQTARTKKYNSVIRKYKANYDKVVAYNSC